MLRCVLLLCALAGAAPALADLLAVSDGCGSSALYFAGLAARRPHPRVGAAREELLAALAVTAARCASLEAEPAVRHAFHAYYSFYVVLEPDGRAERQRLWPRLCALANAGLPAEARPRSIVFVPQDALPALDSLAQLTLHEGNQFAACGAGEPYWR
jgi:hypothetical protein